ncbi:hypothetical protein [Bacillus toyonensis]|nr:hypothetical protein [Bacillus toyonensis]
MTNKISKAQRSQNMCAIKSASKLEDELQRNCGAEGSNLEEM